MQRPVNVGSDHPDTFQRKQNEMHSRVLQQTDYSEYEQITKVGVDIDNFGREH